MRTFPKLIITDKGEHSLRSGHPWVYADEVLTADGYQNGDIVDVYSRKERYLGSGFVNDHSKIRVRILSRNANDRFDDLFWERRLRYAIAYRKTVMGDADFRCCRLIFGEADTFPGLTIDRFEDVLVVQILSLGIERRRDLLISLTVKILREMGETVRVVYLRNDVAIRELEGMAQEVGYYHGEGLATEAEDSGKVIITENGIQFEVDYIYGKKTGFFLDQKYNRQAVAKLAKGRCVLDCYTYSGTFALNALMGGARHVTAVDPSRGAIEQTHANACRNALEGNLSLLCEDVFELLTKLSKERRSPYDFIILDPPAFTKSRAMVQDAYRAYKELNGKAMRLLPRGGYLATCSCSHFIEDDLFCRMLKEAAIEAQVSLRQIEARQQSPDHPILWSVPETDYLKFYLFQVV